MKDFIRQHIFIIAGVLCVLVMGAFFIFGNMSGTGSFSPRGGGEVLTGAPADGRGTPAEDTPGPTGYVVVHVVGEVRNPGVYTLPAGSRVTHAVEMAGGHTAEADLFRVNLAAPLVDAMQVIVPAVGDYSVVGAGTAAFDDGLVCLNGATYAELRTLNGIGTVRANAIISHREAIGGFTHVEQLLDITGIGNAILESIRPYITVR